MAQRTSTLPPSAEKLLLLLGERVKMARLRRKLTAKQVAERAGMTVNTLRAVENGGAGVTIGAYMAVLFVLGLENDIDLVAAQDDVGRQLQDSALLQPRKSHSNSIRVLSTSAIANANAKKSGSTDSRQTLFETTPTNNHAEGNLGTEKTTAYLSSLIKKPEKKTP